MAKEIDILQPAFYREFSCIGPACTDNCCHTWRIDVDKEHYLLYRNQRDPAFKKICAAALRKKKKDATDQNYALMVHPAEGKCSFQAEDGGCLIVRKMGPEALCTTCTVYPRRKAQYLPGLWEYSLSLSCEEVVRLALFSGGPVAFERVRREIDPHDAMDQSAPIYTSGRVFLPPPPFGQPLRQACLDILADRAHPIRERILAIGVLLRRADHLLAEKKPEKITAAIAQAGELLEGGEVARLFQKATYSRDLHLKALRLPLVHFLIAGRKPIFRHIQDALTPYCAYDPEENRYTAGDNALEFLRRITESKADPILREQEQAVENYFTCYLFSGMFPMYYQARGLSLEENAILLAEQYALLRILLGTLEEREGETAEGRLARAVIALARLTQHSDMAKTFRSLADISGLDDLAYAMYLLW